MLHNLFAFEEEFADLHWMPLAMRFRLDVCGLKLPLVSWQSLPFSERLLLLDFSFEGEDQQILWAFHLKNVVSIHGLGKPTPLECWVDPEKIPADVAEKLGAFDCEMSEFLWRNLKPFQRYALCKLARGKQVSRYLSRAVSEFLPQK